MTVTRNYGSFAEAVQEILPGLVATLGYEHRGGGVFARARAGWLEGFELLQSDWPGGDFFILIHIQVPGLAARWQEPDAADRGRCIGTHLGERGIDDHDAWLPAADRQQLEESLATVARWLSAAEPWFADFRSLSDVARVYRRRSALAEAGSNTWWQCMQGAIYGFLLAEAGELAQARVWLQEAERLMSPPVYFVPGSDSDPVPRIVHENVKGAQLLDNNAEAVAQDLAAVRKSLKELEAAADTGQARAGGARPG